MDERFAVAQERQKIERPIRLPDSAKLTPREADRVTLVKSGAATSEEKACWNCGQSGHIKRNCPRTEALPGNGQAPGGHLAPGQNC
jgi:hypothetical protein